MAELGLVVVGPLANAMFVGRPPGVPMVVVRPEPLVPPEEDLPQLVTSAPRTLFRGVDADRWRCLRPEDLLEDTARLWATAQVHSASPAQHADPFEAILVVSWLDEPALAATLRALSDRERPVTVLLRPTDGDGAIARSNHALLAELLRSKRIASVMVHEDPERVLDLVMELASQPVPTLVPRGRALDLGPLLETQPTWCIPAPVVDMTGLVDVHVGRVPELGRLVTLIATWRALGEALSGPPTDVPGLLPVPVEQLRAALPPGDVVGLVQAWVQAALDSVVFSGSESLVDQIERRLRPVLAQVADLMERARAAEDARLNQLRAFSAVGITYTCQTLRGRLDHLPPDETASAAAQLERLLRGEEGMTVGREGVHVTSWRQSFAGLPSGIVRAGEPGAAMALRMVRERFHMFRGEYASAIAKVVGGVVSRAREANAPLSPLPLRELHARACRVRDALKEELAELERRVFAGVDEAVAQDAWVRLAVGSAEAPVEALENALRVLPTFRDAVAFAQVELSMRPLGMADGADFESYLFETVEAVRTLPWRIAAPAWDDVVGALVAGRSAASWAASCLPTGAEELRYCTDVVPGPRLSAFLDGAGLQVRLRPGWEPALVAQVPVVALTSPAAELMRRVTGEHLAADLMLPPPEGDSAGTLAALVRSASLVLQGLVLGELSLRSDESGRVAEVRGLHVSLPHATLLPYGALHALAWDDDLRARLEARVQVAIYELHHRVDALETVQKLIELGHLGLSAEVATDLGVHGGRFEHLMPAVRQLVRRAAETACAVLLERLPSAAAREVLAIPEVHLLHDLGQLTRSGVSA